MVKISKSFRLEKNILEIVDSFNTNTSGADATEKLSSMVTTLNSMIKYTKSELANYFTYDEALLIISAFNGTLYSPNTVNPKAVLIGNVQDSIVLENYDIIYNVDKTALLNKLDRLTQFQSYVVLQMAFDFWSLPDSKRQGTDMIETIKDIFIIRGE